MTPADRVRVVLADDHRMFRDGLRLLIESDGHCTVSGEAADGIDTVRLAVSLRPDVLLLDLAMPRMAGLDVLTELAQQAPEVRVLMLAASIDKTQITTALQRGARGVLLKEAATATLFKAIRAVMDGQYWIERATVGDLVQTLQRLAVEARADRKRGKFGLTKRELQIVDAVAAGDTNKGIAERLQLSEDTVKHHLTHIFDKTGVFTRLELALFAINHRLVDATNEEGTESVPLKSSSG